jgi:hypothetical protein
MNLLMIATPSEFDRLFLIRLMTNLNQSSGGTVCPFVISLGVFFAIHLCADSLPSAFRRARPNLQHLSSTESNVAKNLPSQLPR